MSFEFMFYLITFFFLSGIALHSFFDFAPFYLYFLTLCSVVIYAFNRQQRYKYFTLAVFFLFLGFWRFDLSAVDLKHVGVDHLGYYNGQEVELTGLIVDEPDVRADTVKYTLGDLQKAATPLAGRLKGKLLITLPLYPRFVLGDFLTFRCKLKKPELFEGFAYDKYLAKSGIYSLCYYPKIVKPVEARTRLGRLLDLKKQIFRLKNNFIVQINKILPLPHSALLAGLLLGDTSGLPEFLKQQFVNTGTIHIVAMSGYNIMIIISAFLMIAPYFYISRRLAWLMIVPALIVFVIMTGAESSVVRAALMGLIAALATESGRLSDVKRLLVLTAVIMVLVNPYILRFDVGFQLSFMATLGLVYITPWLEKGVERLGKAVAFFGRIGEKGVVSQPNRSPSWFLQKRLADFLGQRRDFFLSVARPLRYAATTTLGANLAVAPILLWHFGRVSLISPLVNTLILWIIPFTMLIGFMATLASYLLLPLGRWLGWLAWLLLEYIVEVVRMF